MESKAAFCKELLIQQKNIVEINSLYTIKEQISKTSLCTIYKVLDNATQEIKAMKVYHKSHLSSQGLASFMVKFNNIKKLMSESPYIVKIQALYEDPSNIYLIMEFLQGDRLDNYVASLEASQFSENRILQIIWQILSAIQFCHLNGLPHLKLSPTCFMFTDKQNQQALKLISFNLTDEIEMQATKKNSNIYDVLLYMSPELASGLKGEFASDIWSCGIISYFLMSGLSPYGISTADTPASIFIKIKTKAFTKSDFEIGVWPKISQKSKGFIFNMLYKEPKHRSTAEDLLKMKWFDEKNATEVDKEIASEVMTKLRKIFSVSRFQQAVTKYICYHCDLKEQAERLRLIFKKLDSDKSQTISNEELKSGYNEMSGLGLTNKELDALFSKMDIDHSGSISYSEFMSGAINVSMSSSEGILKQAFEVFDLDKNGTIEKMEIIKGLEGYITSKEVEELFAKYDTNKNNKLSFDEFKNMILQFSGE